MTPEQETARLVDSLGAEALAKAQAYTTGNHWLLLGGVLLSVFLAWVMVRLRLLDRVAARLEGRRWWLATLLTGMAFFAIGDFLRLPWTLLFDWKRERDYGLSKQPLGDFLGQLAISEVLSIVLGGLFLLGIYALIRKTGQRWWTWAAGFTGLVTVAMLLAAPTLLMPLFNTFEPVPPGPVRTALENIADDVQIPHDRIFMYDGSRQSEYFTANVAGIGPSARIAISDVALKKASLAEVRAVTGHEAGHYKLGHSWRYIVVFPILAALVLWLINRLFASAARLLGSDAQLHEARGMPVFMALTAVITLFTSPLQNSLTRIGEADADRYSLATVGEPDGLATALLKTVEYRYARPGPIEEVLFYNHPSVEKRILQAMEWKAAHPPAMQHGQ